jgi:molybdopterin converting factor subunit 1
MFAGLAEAVGAPSVELDMETPAKVADIKRVLAARYPSIKPLLAVSFAAVNQAYAGDEAVIQAGDEVALIPPVSGG